MCAICCFRKRNETLGGPAFDLFYSDAPNKAANPPLKIEPCLIQRQRRLNACELSYSLRKNNYGLPGFKTLILRAIPLLNGCSLPCLFLKVIASWVYRT